MQSKSNWQDSNFRKFDIFDKIQIGGNYSFCHEPLNCSLCESPLSVTSVTFVSFVLWTSAMNHPLFLSSSPSSVTATPLGLSLDSHHSFWNSKASFTIPFHQLSFLYPGQILFNRTSLNTSYPCRASETVMWTRTAPMMRRKSFMAKSCGEWLMCRQEQAFRSSVIGLHVTLE